jgi:ABC-type antimicrobial peptide transport system permease subunit
VQFVVRSQLSPALQLKAVAQALRTVEPNAGLQVATMFDSIGLAFLPSQIGAALMGSAGLLALVLSAVGLYGVMSYSVVRRLPEIGVRMALGATGGDISRLVVGDAVRLLVMGTALGLVGALLVTRPLSMFLVKGLSSTDPMTFAVVFMVLLTTALAAAWGPVQRASRVEPTTVLRQD